MANTSSNFIISSQNASSTEVRNKIALNDFKNIDVESEVLSYIIEHGLYKKFHTDDIVSKKSMLNYNSAFEASLIMNDIYIRPGVYAVIVNNHNEILLTKTQSGTRFIYNFPGGGIDTGEGFSDALQRECKEELGAEISISKLLYSSKQLYPHSDFPYSRMFNLYYKVTLHEPENIKALDCESISWFKLTELPLNDMLDIDKEFIDFFISNNMAK